MQRVMETVEMKGTGPLRHRELCVLVALDEANAFNSARWDKISDALGKKLVPKYLQHTIHSYLSNRSLTFGEAQNREITCGVLQGSVIL